MARNATPSKPKPNRPDRSIKRAIGASAAKTSLKDRLTSWQEHHRDSLLDALRRMVQQRSSSIMTILVIAIALALPTGLTLLLDNAKHLTQDWDGETPISVYLDLSLSDERQQQLAERWRNQADIADTRLITRQQAMDEFRALSGFGEVLDALPDNPLPALIIVTPRDTHPSAVDALQQRLKQERGVDLVELDLEWVQRLHALIELGQRLISALTLALALAVMLIVVNTIRLGIENRRDEILVIKIVGGTDGFVRRPFLYTGFCFGFIGGLVAAVLVQITLLWLSGPVDTLLSLYQSDDQLRSLDLTGLLTLPLFSGLLGLLGAWLAVNRHLHDIEPNF